MLREHFERYGKLNFQVIEKLSAYDFREEFPIDKYPSRIIYNSEIKAERLRDEDVFEKYITYKALTEKKVESDKAPCAFDADNSNGKCDLMGEIYRKLWGADIKYSDFVCINAFPVDNDKRILLFGGDVYHSVQTSINKACSKSLIECLKMYSYDANSFIKELRDKGFSEILKVSHVLGNFGLVPAYFNGHRGLDGDIKDYLDKSLKVLYRDGFDYRDTLIEKNKSKEKKNDVVAFKHRVYEKYRMFSREDFNKYINVMFLWDMIDHTNKDNIVNVKCISDNLQQWKCFTPKMIRRRSLFMAVMLYFAEYRDNIYQEFSKKIAGKKCILDYSSAFDLICEQGLDSMEREIISKARCEIGRISLDESNFSCQTVE